MSSSAFASTIPAPPPSTSGPGLRRCSFPTPWGDCYAEERCPPAEFVRFLDGRSAFRPELKLAGRPIVPEQELTPHRVGKSANGARELRERAGVDCGRDAVQRRRAGNRKAQWAPLRNLCSHNTASDASRIKPAASVPKGVRLIDKDGRTLDPVAAYFEILHCLECGAAFPACGQCPFCTEGAAA